MLKYPPEYTAYFLSHPVYKNPKKEIVTFAVVHLFINAVRKTTKENKKTMELQHTECLNVIEDNILIVKNLKHQS